MTVFTVGIYVNVPLGRQLLSRDQCVANWLTFTRESQKKKKKSTSFNALFGEHPTQSCGTLGQEPAAAAVFPQRRRDDYSKCSATRVETLTARARARGHGTGKLRYYSQFFDYHVGCASVRTGAMQRRRRRHGRWVGGEGHKSRQTSRRSWFFSKAGVSSWWMPCRRGYVRVGGVTGRRRHLSFR